MENGRERRYRVIARDLEGLYSYNYLRTHEHSVVYLCERYFLIFNLSLKFRPAGYPTWFKLTYYIGKIFQHPLINPYPFFDKHLKRWGYQGLKRIRAESLLTAKCLQRRRWAKTYIRTNDPLGLLGTGEGE